MPKRQEATYENEATSEPRRAQRIALQLSRILDRNHCRAEFCFQNRPDRVAAKRRQLQAPVGRQACLRDYSKRLPLGLCSVPLSDDHIVQYLNESECDNVKGIRFFLMKSGSLCAIFPIIGDYV